MLVRLRGRLRVKPFVGSRGFGLKVIGCKAIFFESNFGTSRIVGLRGSGCRSHGLGRGFVPKKGSFLVSNLETLRLSSCETSVHMGRCQN